MEGQPAPARTAIYNYICPESGAGASPLREDCFSCDEMERGKRNGEMSRRHAFPVFHSREQMKTIMLSPYPDVE